MRLDHSGRVRTLPDIRVMIGIPSRSKTCFLEFATSLSMTVVRILEKGWQLDIKTSNNDCFVDTARNQLVAGFMHSDCTHLLMIDDDMSWEPEKVIEMIESGKEFIAAAGNLKTEKPKYACQNYTDEIGHPIVENGLIKALWVGGAFTLHKRSVFEKMIKEYAHLKCLNNDVEHDKYGYSFYHTRQTRKEYVTEDKAFCELWSNIGGEIWIYPDMNFTHFGYKEFKGNFHEYLLRQPEGSKSESNGIKETDLPTKGLRLNQPSFHNHNQQELKTNE